MAQSNISAADHVRSDDLKQNNELYRSAATAVQAGIAATAKKYSEIDNHNARVNPESGAFPYDNSKSIHYV